MIVFPASLGQFSESKLKLVSQISVFRWDRTCLTTNAAEMDCMWGGEPLCGNMHARHPRSESNLFIQNPQSVVKMHLKTFTNALPTTKPGERQRLLVVPD